MSEKVNLGRVAYVEKGAYDGGTTYQKKDVVFYNNGSYVYIADAPAAGIVPTDTAYWQPMLDPTPVNQAAVTANQAAETANQAANAANTAANAANTAAEAADNARLAISDELNKKAPAIFVDASGDMVHITDGAEGMPVQSLITHVEPVEIGEGEKSPANPWTIIGWDSVTEQRTGANLLDINAIKSPYIEISGNTITVTPAAGTAVQPSVKIKDILPNAKAGMEVMLSGETDGRSSIYIYDKQYLWNFGSSLTLTTEILNSSFYLYGKSDGSAATITGLQIEAGSTATAYEPYQGKTLTAELPETVYGGYRNWTTGEQVRTKSMYQFTGNEVIQQSADKTWFTVNRKDNSVIGLISAEYDQTRKNVVCSHFVGASYKESVEGCVSVYYGTNGETIGFRTTAFSDVAAFSAFLREQYSAGTPVTIVFDMKPAYWTTLASGTPQQLETLKGTNNIWSDAGATEVTYAADTKLYIDGKIAAIAAAIVNE